jgi:hypothetical protein
MGTGAFVEIIEFSAVVFLGAAEQVGDYFNNAIDLLFNLTGSGIACFFIMHYHRKANKSVYFLNSNSSITGRWSENSACSIS